MHLGFVPSRKTGFTPTDFVHNNKRINRKHLHCNSTYLTTYNTENRLIAPIYFILVSFMLISSNQLSWTSTENNQQIVKK